MYFLVVVTVLGLFSIGGQANDFTINTIELIPLPSTKLRNGDKLELKCDVKFAKTTEFTLNSTFTFYRDDEKIYTISSTEDRVSYNIMKVRVSHSGKYNCKVSVASSIKTSHDVEIRVTGLSVPFLNVSSTEVQEGEDVTVRCEAPEEWSYMTFTFYKTNDKRKEVKTKSSPANYQEVTFNIREGEEFSQFTCNVHLPSIGETSQINNPITVAVVAPFATPRIEVLPSLNFTEGENMSVKCSVQESPGLREEIKLTLQKDGHIIKSSTVNTLSYLQVATVDDMGNYTCKAEGKRTSKSNSVKIDVTELFPRPSLTLRNSTKEQYIDEGEYVTLKCSVAGVAPDAATSLKYKFIENRRTTYTRTGGNFYLTMAEKHSGSYVCQVTISNITKESTPLVIQVYAPVKNPVLTHILRSNRSVVLGDTMELTCKCQSGTPPITYTLFRGVHLLQKKTMEGNTEAQFLVNSSKSHDLGQYRCQATNRNTRSTEKYSNIVNVTVIIPISSANLTIIPSNGYVEEGSELSLICWVKDGTLPINFQFYKKKGNEILVHNVTETKQLHTSYQVPTFSKQGDGTYFCAASNRAHKQVRSNSTDAKAVLATWKKGVIGIFVLLIILAATAICVYLHMDKKKKGKDNIWISGSTVKHKGKDISTEKSRSSKSVTTNNQKPTEEIKEGESNFGGVKNEDELHILKTGQENPGNNHEMEHTEADGGGPDAHPAVDDEHNRTEDAPESNSHP